MTPLLSILWPRSLPDLHHHDGEFWKLLEGLRSGFAKELISRQQAFEAGIDRCAHQFAIGETLPPTLASCIAGDLEVGQNRDKVHNGVKRPHETCR